MSMSYSEKIAKIVSFGNNQYYPSLKAMNGKDPKDEDIIITDEILNRISQNICNKCNDVNYIEGLDVEDYFSLLDMFTNGGVVYRDETGSYYEEDNKAFTASLLGNIAFTCDKIGTPLDEDNFGEMILPTPAEDNVSGKRDINDFIMFLTGDSLGYHKKYGNNVKKTMAEPETEVLSEDTEPSLSEQKERLINERADIMNRVENLKLDDFKPKRTL